MSASVQVASGLTFTMPRPTSRCTIGAFARVGALDPAQPGHPRLLAVERAGERLDLAHRAALVGVGLPEIVGRDERLHHREVQVVALTDPLDVPERLGEVVLRVEEHDLDAGRRAAPRRR